MGPLPPAVDVTVAVDVQRAVTGVCPLPRWVGVVDPL